MKKFFILACFLAACGLATLPLAMVPGCTAPQQRITVNTLYSTHVTVDGAFTGYMSAVLAGKVATNGVPTVAQAYRDFQTAYNLAVEFVSGNTNAATPPGVTSAAAKVLSLTQ